MSATQRTGIFRAVSTIEGADEAVGIASSLGSPRNVSMVAPEGAAAEADGSSHDGQDNRNRSLRAG